MAHLSDLLHVVQPLREGHIVAAGHPAPGDGGVHGGEAPAVHHPRLLQPLVRLAEGDVPPVGPPVPQLAVLLGGGGKGEGRG